MAILDFFRKLFGSSKPKNDPKAASAEPEPPKTDEPAPQNEHEPVQEPVPEAPSQLLAITCIGQSHIKHGTPCQDSSLCYQGNAFRMIAVSDGHGSTSCPRSDRGSRLACRIAQEVFTEFAETVSLQNRDTAARDLCAEICRRWKAAVLSDYENEPFSEAELEKVSEKYLAHYQSGRQGQHAYGATLIAAVESAAGILAIRCGDGECIAIDSQGRFSRPIPWNDKCDVNVTTSLCDTDAVEEFRWAWLEEMPAALWISTDGVDNSYPDPADLQEFYANLSVRALEQGCAAVTEELQSFLPMLTQRCSQDDLSVAAMVEPSALAAARDRLYTHVELRGALRQQSELQRRLKVIARTLREKESKPAPDDALQQEISALRAEEIKLTDALSAQEEKLAQLRLHAE